jgi:hypothetical protein
MCHDFQALFLNARFVRCVNARADPFDSFDFPKRNNRGLIDCQEASVDKPYDGPKANVADRREARSFEELEQLRTGQQVLFFAVALWILYGVVKGSNGGRAIADFFLIIVLIIVGCIGSYRVGKGLGHSTFVSILWCICWLIPFVNFLALLYLAIKPTKILKAAGYTVGLLGAKKRVA